MTGTATCSALGVVAVDVVLSQTQKITGKFSTIVQASGTTSVDCIGTSSWSITLTPSTGSFDNGTATGTATTSGGLGTLPSTVTSTVKMFAVKK